MIEQEPGHVEGLGARAAGEGVGEGVLPAPVLNHHLIVPENFSALKQIIKKICPAHCGFASLES